ncbi:MAG TPA: acetoacetate--CoA ligase [Vicinamibacterales bacterium]|jgi:acetoacetyl-CoA synthetase|nr:acetoacetate--CoA ligase [Vicinamibacterales bacterium]
MESPLWTPSPESVERARITHFMRHLRDRGAHVSDYRSLYDFSITQPLEFWRAVWDFCGIIGHRGERIAIGMERMPGAQFFPDARLNFAENVLRQRGSGDALVFNGENQRHRILSHDELRAEVGRFAAGLHAAGVRAGDRVGAYIPNMPEAMIASLGAATIGAVWSSCSPDFGVQGVLDRFGQIEPRVIVASDGYFYAGRVHDIRPKLAAVLEKLPSVERTIVVPYVKGSPSLDGLPNAVLWREFTRSAATIPEFERLPFDHPLYILYSSGTTGVPKCIVHGAGGTLIQHLKEHQLQCDVQAGDRVFYFTTCGWMMWNWLVTALASNATLLLYDGSPFHPDGNVLFDFADATSMTLFGTSARFIDAVHKANLSPVRTHDLASVRTMTSTGSPLVAESFDFVYESIKHDIHLASISGGTDIVSCFVGGNPVGPVWRGEIQARALGMKVDVFDDTGHPVTGDKGELVCTMPFPSMPIGFWNDPDGRKYHAAYFERFPGVWRHGDWAEITEHEGVIIYGRSDAVLNPGGVRIGTAEIYRQVEQLDEITESLVIGQQWQNDERIVLFVKLRDGLVLSDEMQDRIRRRIRENTTPRHVPARIVQITDVPRTKSGKIVELAVRDVVHGRSVKNIEALANPEALDQYRSRPELS